MSDMFFARVVTGLWRVVNGTPEKPSGFHFAARKNVKSNSDK